MKGRVVNVVGNAFECALQPVIRLELAGVPLSYGQVQILVAEWVGVDKGSLTSETWLLIPICTPRIAGEILCLPWAKDQYSDLKCTPMRGFRSGVLSSDTSESERRMHR